MSDLEIFGSVLMMMSEIQHQIKYPNSYHNETTDEVRVYLG